MSLVYDEGCWNPYTQTGTRRYRSDLLMLFRDVATRAPNDLDPQLCKMISLNKRIPTATAGNPRVRMQVAGRKGSVRKITLGGSKVMLVRSENAWTPHSLAKTPETAETEHKRKLQKKQIAGDLNKLTLERFDPISKRIFETLLALENKDDISFLVTELLLRVQDQHSFSSIYAQLCKFLINDARVAGVKDADPISKQFRLTLLNKCQEEFERDNTRDRQELDQKASGPLTDDQELEKIKQKRWMIGRIKFIGELFKLRLVSDNIIFRDCLPRLLAIAEDELVLEALSQLLTTAGKLLDEKDKPRLDQVFDQIRKIMSRPGLSSRVRFKLQDLIELRERKWQERNLPAGPRKLAEIREEAAAAASTATSKTASEADRRGRGAPPGRTDDRRSNPGRGGGNAGRGGYRDDRGGSQGRPASSRPLSENFGKLSSQPAAGVKLGPSGWAANAARGAAAPAQPAATAEPRAAEKNGFQALENLKTPEEIIKLLATDENEEDDATKFVTSLERPARGELVSAFFQACTYLRSNETTRVCEWLVSLTNSRLIEQADFLRGIPVDELEDIAEDVPKIFDHLAQLLAALLQTEFITFAVFSEEPLKKLSPNRTKKVVAEIVNGLSATSAAAVPAELLVTSFPKIKNPAVALQGLLQINAMSTVSKILAATEPDERANVQYALAIAAIKATVAQTTKDLNSVDEAGEKAQEAKMKEYAPLLLHGAESVPDDKQGPIVDALHACNDELKFPANFAKRWLNTLYEVDLVTEEGVKLWSKVAQNKELTVHEATSWLVEMEKQN